MHGGRDSPRTEDIASYMIVRQEPLLDAGNFPFADTSSIQYSRLSQQQNYLDLSHEHYALTRLAAPSNTVS